MAQQRQRSHGPRAMALTAQRRANESGKPCYLIYDTSERSYYASFAPEPGEEWGRHEQIVKEFLPRGGR